MKKNRNMMCLRFHCSGFYFKDYRFTSGRGILDGKEKGDLEVFLVKQEMQGKSLSTVGVCVMMASQLRQEHHQQKQEELQKIRLKVGNPKYLVCTHVCLYLQHNYICNQSPLDY